LLARNEVIFKWSLYAAAGLLCLLFQGAVFQRFTIWGAIPFLYPLLAAIPATYESPMSGTIFALCVGVVCDLLLPGNVPCLYTLIFPLAGLCGALLSKSLLPAGFLCSLAASAGAFLLTDTFRCFLLWATGHGAWRAGLFLMVREFCVTVPLVIPVNLLFRAVFRKVHIYD
jgi:hypothetical protein